MIYDCPLLKILVYSEKFLKILHLISLRLLSTKVGRTEGWVEGSGFCSSAKYLRYINKEKIFK